MADTPFIKYGTSSDAKRLFFSEPNASRRIPRTVSAGFGILTHGLILAENLAAGSPNLGKLLPYDPTAVTGKEEAPGRAYLVEDSAGAANEVSVTVSDSYKFVVGDTVRVKDDTTAAEVVGAITAIDNTTYKHKATITFTTALGGTAFTVARFAYISHADSVNAVGILGKSVDTLADVDALDGNTVLIMGNAVLYKGVIVNRDATSLAALNAKIVGPYLDMP